MIHILETKFSYKNKDGETATLEKTFTLDTLEITPEFELLLEEFKCFLRGMEYCEKTIDKIQIVEENEQK